MAQTLAPVFGASISGESAVQTTSALEPLSGMVSAFARAAGSSSGPTAAQVKAQRDSSAMSFFQEQEARANQYIEQGDMNTANRVRRQALISMQANGFDTSDGAFKQTLMAVTGEDPDFYGRSAEEIQRDNIRQDPKFTTLYAATDPSLPPDLREEKALSDFQADAAIDRRIQVAQKVWDADGQKAYMDKLALVRERGLSLYSANLQPGGTSVQEIQQARMEITRLQAGLQRPAGVTDAQWKPIQDTMDQNIALLDTLEGVMGAEGMKGVSQAESQRIVQLVGRTALGQATNIGQAARAALILSGDPKVVADALGNLPDSVASLSKLYESPFNADSLHLQPGAYNEKVKASLSGLDPKEKYKVASGMSDMFNGKDVSSQIKKGPAEADAWAQGTMTTLSAISSLTSDQTSSWVQANDYDRFFGENFFLNLNSLQEVNPKAANEIRIAALDAINTQAGQLEALLEGFGQDSAFIWNPNEGTFTLNPNPVGQDLGGLTSDRVRQTLDRAVTELYNGDVGALINDKGARIRRASAGGGVFGTTESGNWNHLSNVLDGYFRKTAPANAALYAKTYAKNQEMYQRLHTESAGVAGLELPEPDSEDVSSGVFSQTTQSFNERPAQGLSVTQTLMDKYEGGGDYSTLLGHSQRSGGSFSGTDVTKMTLAQVSEFSNPRGKYGQWSKGQVGRVATPMGRFQIVGTTLRETAKLMGLDMNTTLFDENTQNAMFDFIANRALGNKQGAAARTAMRNTWEGFKKATDQEVDQMISEIRSGQPLFGPGSTYVGNANGTVGLAGQNPELLLPPATQDSALQTPGQLMSRTELDEEGQVRTTEYNNDGSVRSSFLTNGTPEERATDQARQDERVSQENHRLSVESQEVLDKLGLSRDTPVFKNQGDFYKAMMGGQLKFGNTVVVNGEAVTL